MWTRWALGILIGLAARAWLASLRLTLVLDPHLDPTSTRPWSLAFWHGQQFALLRWRRRRATVALVSLSRDGQMQAAALPARLSGGLVVPMASACSSLRVLTRTWDRFELPLPFSRVVVVLGAPIE